MKKKEKKSEYQKLLDLLNEYEDPMVSWYDEYVEEFGVFMLNNKEQGIAEEIVISKSFGFIKWLVENEKIDCVKVIQKKGHREIENAMVGFKERNYLELLMLLSISDTPIEDLISYLK